MSRQRFLTVTALALVLALATILTGCSSPTREPSSIDGSSGLMATPTPTPAPNPSTSNNADQGGHAVIVIKDFSFTPSTVTVNVGTLVVWQNNGKRSHTVAFDDGSASSPRIPSGGIVSHRFAKVGAFRYHCSLHPKMKGTVIVK